MAEAEAIKTLMDTHEVGEKAPRLQEMMEQTCREATWQLYLQLLSELVGPGIPCLTPILHKTVEPIHPAGFFLCAFSPPPLFPRNVVPDVASLFSDCSRDCECLRTPFLQASLAHGTLGPLLSLKSLVFHHYTE